MYDEGSNNLVFTRVSFQHNTILRTPTLALLARCPLLTFPLIVSCQVNGTTSEGYGGAFYAYSGDVVFDTCNIIDNSIFPVVNSASADVATPPPVRGVAPPP